MKRNPSLDVLRAVAILLVLGHHYRYYTAWTRGGWMGVDLFFVLSGFLISGLLFSEYRRTGAIEFGRFFIRRGFKIYPPYFAFLLLTLPLSKHYLGWQDFAFMQSYFRSFWGHCWSLSVEEHFYLALPLVQIASAHFAPSRFGWITAACPIIVLGCLALRAALGPQATPQQVLMPTHLRFDALFAGVTLSWFYHFKSSQFSRLRSHWLPVACVLLVGWQFLWEIPPYLSHTLGFTANLIGFSLLLSWAMNTWVLSKLKPLASVGRYSYSIYLWHLPLSFLFHQVPGAHSALGFWLYVPTAIFCGIAMSLLVEMPALTVRDRWFPALSHRKDEGAHAAGRSQAPCLVNT